MKIVQAYGEEEKEIKNFNKHLNSSLKTGVKASFLTSLGFAVNRSMLYFMGASGIWFGFYLVYKGVQNDIEGTEYTSGLTRGIYMSVFMGMFSILTIAPSFKYLADGKMSAYEAD